MIIGYIASRKDGEGIDGSVIFSNKKHAEDHASEMDELYGEDWSVKIIRYEVVGE